MSTPITTGFQLPLAGYWPQGGTSASTPGASAPTLSTRLSDSMSFASVGEGPILPLAAKKWTTIAALTVPTGTEAAIGAARTILKNPNFGASADPLFKLSASLFQNVFRFVGKLLTFQLDEAFGALMNIFKDGAINLGGIAKKLASPFTATAAAAGAPRAGLGQAIAGGISTGMRALKTSFVWAIPAAAVNAFIDYKYRDQTDVKRLGTNFAADVLGYTATGMAGAAVGAAVGSMTMPIIGTVVGAGVGIMLGMAHEKMTRPMLSDMLRDQMG